MYDRLSQENKKEEQQRIVPGQITYNYWDTFIIQLEWQVKPII